MTDPQTSDGLSSRLRAATTPEHRDTEGRSFITLLMGGELDRSAYVRYLAQYTYVYRALEERAAQPGDPAFLHDEALRRVPSMEADLEALDEGAWETTMPPLPATQAYVDHLRGLDAADVPRYVAHHYTRYLGDLSGGQAIAALVARHYGIEDHQLAFYRFSQIDSPVRYKRAYRDQLDALELDSAQEATLIAEAKGAFGFNAAIFEALGADTALAAR